MKVCKRCNNKLGLSQFYKHIGMADGHLNVYKDCTKKRVQNHYYINFTKIQSYEQQRALSPERIKYATNRNKEYRLKNSKAYIAHNLVSNALRDGKLQKRSLFNLWKM